MLPRSCELICQGGVYQVDFEVTIGEVLKVLEILGDVLDQAGTLSNEHRNQRNEETDEQDHGDPEDQHRRPVPSPPSPDQALNRRFQGDSHERGEKEHVDEAPDAIKDQEGCGGERNNHDDNDDRVRKPDWRSLQPSARRSSASHCRR